eukprot:6204012-Pleurochrysis_carterae.AAC.5
MIDMRKAKHAVQQVSLYEKWRKEDGRRRSNCEQAMTTRARAMDSRTRMVCVGRTRMACSGRSPKQFTQGSLCWHKRMRSKIRKLGAAKAFRVDCTCSRAVWNASRASVS